MLQGKSRGQEHRSGFGDTDMILGTQTWVWYLLQQWHLFRLWPNHFSNLLSKGKTEKIKHFLLTQGSHQEKCNYYYEGEYC